jgi:hypothetical protein
MAYSPNQRVKGHALIDGGVGVKLKHIGLCHYEYKLGDEKFGTEIFITPNLTNQVQIVGVLIHEMIHAITKGHGHKNAFRWLAVDVGLEGKMTATSVGVGLKKEIKKWIQKYGRMPHKKWIPNTKGKQTTRMLKVYCKGEVDYEEDRDCEDGRYEHHSEFIIRQSRRALLQFGTPICPECNERMVVAE